jgi:nucleotide-binding universal stress UspA family protein
MKDSPVVVVPWDFSTYSAQSLEYALELTEPESVRVVCVLDEPAAYDPSILDGYNRDEAERICHESFRKAVFPMLQNEANFTVCFGNPAEEILQIAREIHPDMIVMATHGKTGLKRLLIGSVAEKVLRNANCPVMILPRDWVETRSGEHDTVAAGEVARRGR